LAQWHNRGGVAADVAEMRAAHGEKTAALVERKLDLRDQVAALIVAEERFTAFADVFDGAADPLRSPQHQRKLGEDRILGPEVAADVVSDHADVLGLDPEHARKLAFLAHHAAAAGVQKIASALLVVIADGSARLHRHTGDALHPGLELHD